MNKFVTHNAVSYRQLEKEPAVPVGSLLRDLDGLPQHRLGRVHQVLENKPVGEFERHSKTTKQPLLQMMHYFTLPFMLYIKLMRFPNQSLLLTSHDHYRLLDAPTC